MKNLEYFIKHILLFVFILTLATVITGCNKKTDEVTKIKFSSWGSQSELAVLNDLIKDFERDNPKIKVEFLHIPQNYFQKLHLLFASKLEPDVIFLNNIYAPIYIKAGLLEDLTPYFNDELKTNNYFKNATGSFTYDNKLYAIPRDISNLVIYYNKDIFDKQHVKYPTKNWSLQELRQTANSVATKNNYGLNNEKTTLFWIYYLESNGGGILSDDSKEIIINKTQSIEALQLYADMINKDHSIPTFAQKASMTSAQMFLQGKLAMFLSGRWLIPKFRESADFDWDIVEFPSSNKNKVLIDSSGWAISKSSSNKEAAVLLIKYLSSKSSTEKFTKSGLIIPARIDVAQSSIFLDSKNPKNSIAFTDMLKNAKPTPTNENYLKLNDILEIELEPVFDGKKQAKEIMTQKLLNKLNELL